MEIKKIKPSDFKSIAKNNEYYLWSFLQRKQNEGDLNMWSLFDDKVNKKNKIENKLIDFLKIFPINFYESYVDESVDFLLDRGIGSELIYKNVILDIHPRVLPRSYFYNPCILLFKKYQMIDCTFFHCYCIEGLTDMVISNIPNLLENSKIN